jgi:vacuolar-type H+-ATPase subunit I/STV1
VVAKLKTSAEKVISELKDAPYELGAHLPEVSFEPFKDDLGRVEEHVESVEAKAQLIDQACKALTAVQDKISSFYKVVSQ